MDRIVSYWNAIQDKQFNRKAPVPVQPSELGLYNAIGESRLLRAGGLFNQPAKRWLMAHHAGYLWDIIDRRAKEKDLQSSTLTNEDREVLKEIDKRLTELKKKRMFK